MQRIAGRLAGFFAARGYLDPEQREVAAYGFDLLIYTLLSTLGLLLAGAVLGRGVQAALIVGLFYLNQTFGGGFHARTHLRCFATMLLFLLPGVLTGPWHPAAEAGIALLALLCLLLKPLVLHPNKRYLEGKRQAFVRRSRRIALAEGLLFAAAFAFLPPGLRHAAAMGLFASALSRAAGALQSRGRARRPQP